ncbi:RING/U-box superfamily protein [Carex rostrata]
MSFVFRGSRADIGGGFPDLIPDRRPMRIHAGRTVNSNSMAFLVTVFLLFMILNSHQMSPNFLLWLVLGVFLIATALRMYATCQQLQAHANAVAASGLLRHTELQLHVPPSIAIASRGHMQGLRLQLALFDRDFDDLDYDTLRALDSEDIPHAVSMSEEEINALPVHKYKKHSDKGPTSNQSDGSNLPQRGSTSGSTNEIGKENLKSEESGKSSEDELTCSVCLEQVNEGDLLRSLPCLHQFHASCIDPWLRQQGTCPVCKYRVNGETDASFMV